MYYFFFKVNLVDFFDFTKINSILSIITMPTSPDKPSFKITNLPVPIYGRVTMEFWIFIYNMDASPSLYDTLALNFVYENFLSISIFRTTSTTNNEISIHCFPLEEYYRTKINNNAVGIKNYIANEYPFTREIKSKINHTWIFVRCAYSIQLKKFYLNKLGESGLKMPVYYEYVKDPDPDPAYISQDAFFNYVHLKENSRSRLRLEGFQTYSDHQLDQISSLSSSNIAYNQIYLRNLNIYREYIPNTVNYPNYL